MKTNINKQTTNNKQQQQQQRKKQNKNINPDTFTCKKP